MLRCFKILIIFKAIINIARTIIWISFLLDPFSYLLIAWILISSIKLIKWPILIINFLKYLIYINRLLFFICVKALFYQLSVIFFLFLIIYRTINLMCIFIIRIQSKWTLGSRCKFILNLTFLKKFVVFNKFMIGLFVLCR